MMMMVRLLQGVILLQGRMYIFPRHVCFSCDLFGNSKSIKIGFHEIIGVLFCKAFDPKQLM
jgi:hypothetical protein